MNPIQSLLNKLEQAPVLMLHNAVGLYKSIEILEYVDVDESAPVVAPFQTVGRTAVFKLHGPFFDHEEPRIKSFYPHVGNYETRKWLEGLSKTSFDAVHFDIDSPGGMVSGLQELADAVKGLKAKGFRVTGHTSGLAASAAYFIASQLDSFTASPSAHVGSVGTIIGLYDYSKMFKEHGVEAKPIANHELKSTGFVGAPLTANQEAYLKDLVDKHTNNFKSYVKDGRKMTQSQVDSIATGQLFLSQDALRLGLIDSIQTDAVIGANSVQQTAPQQKTERKTTKMDEEAIKQLNALLAPLTQAVTAVGQRVDAVESANRKEKEAAEKKTLITAAQADGRITPNQLSIFEALAEKVSVEDLKTQLSKIEPIVTGPTSTIWADETVHVPVVGKLGLNAQDVQILETFGFDVETTQKFGDFEEYSMISRELVAKKTPNGRPKLAKVKANMKRIPGYFGERCLSKLNQVEIEEVQ